ncbi:DoxX family protein [Oceanicella sp. SM1341]|uniref:DoxX family protein n=1 Tax=Oceanicella sp. SM1341 TaxID=1548889 RepID=UPI001E56279D|nr:DoxX family protein [Oceanicella sp. SM1341]
MKTLSVKTFPWRHLCAGLLAAFFVLGGSLNLFPSEEIRADYVRWGYPASFHIVTGILEWVTAALLVVPFSRLAGSLLGAGVMIAAAVTVVANGEHAHAVPPLVVLALLMLNGWLTWRGRAAGRD